MAPSRKRDSKTAPAAARERVAIVGLVSRRIRRPEAERSLEELAGLTAAVGGTVVLRMLQERDAPDSATFLGRGKIETLARACDESVIDLVVFDNELSPAQMREIEAAVARKVLDRTQLILDIFARRARTREAKGQVELAQLKYLLPRLVGAGAALSRLGGGIGTRGPGETKLETDRRRVRQRIHVLQEDIDQVRGRRRYLRGRRRKAAVPTVALVGYTNAGKTTLFNRLTRQHAEASDALFVTLDPLVRQVRLPDRRALLVFDTVGFIERLPHTLVAAFRATLEEVAGADLILHVIDAADPARDRHIEAVLGVLEEVGAADVPMLDVLNKCDKLDERDRARLALWPRASVRISALHGDGHAELLEAVANRVALDTRRVRLEFDDRRQGDRDRIARLYRHGKVLSHVAVDHRVSIEADVPRRLLDRLEVAETNA